MPNQNDKPPYLNSEHLARRYKCSPRTIERWRYEGRGPTYFKMNGRVLYHIDDLVEFETTCRRTNTYADIVLPESEPCA